MTTLDAVSLSPQRGAPEFPAHTEAIRRRTEVQARRQLLICLSMLYSTVLFSTLALPAGTKQVPVSFLAGLLLFGLLGVLTRFAFDLFRLLAVAAALAVITLESALFPRDYSPTSLLYVAGVYLPLALTLPLLDASAFRTIWKHVSILGLAAAICGLIQLAGQLLLGGLFLDPIRTLPESLLFQGYNTTYSVTYGASLMKPNGMFLLEPSYFSQLLALGLIGEFVYFHRKWRVVVLMAALTFSFSGTGILMLAPAMLFVGSSRVLLGVAFVAIALATVVIALGYGDYFAGRAAESGDSGTSGNLRFVAPYQAMVQQWNDSTTICLFGKGAGSTEREVKAVKMAPQPIPKVSLEYGVVGLSVFVILWFAIFYRLALPPAMRVALFILYFLATSAFLQAFTVYMLWALSAGFLRKSVTSGPSGTTIRFPASSDTSFREAPQGSRPLAIKGSNQWIPNQN